MELIPCVNQAARASFTGAKLLFAFSLVLRLQSLAHWLLAYSLTPVDPILPPAKIHYMRV